jgi:ribose transport system substrate-binding protein
VALPPFGGTGPAGPPTSLPRRVAWANTSDTEIFVALGQGIEAAARDRNLDYLTAIAANDPARNVSQMNTFLARGIGSMAVQPLDPVAQRTPLDHALKQGVFVQGIITNPSTLQVAASQYHIGFTQGKAAADYARGHLGGQAQVHYFNQDQLSPQLKVRHQGVLAGLKTGGSGVQVVSDLSANAADGSIEGGFRLMSTVMEAHPRIKIVLGSDTLVTGAYRALEQTGKLTPDMYLSGVDGDSNALALVKEGGPYRASLAFAWSLMGYGMGRFAADWIDGRSVPRIMVARAVLLDSPALVDEYLADNADPAGVFADGRRYQHYLPLLGNVSYATRHTVWQQEYVPR